MKRIEYTAGMKSTRLRGAGAWELGLSSTIINNFIDALEPRLYDESSLFS
jgi:hypothetical protein